MYDFGGDRDYDDTALSPSRENRTPEPLLLTARRAASLCGVSTRTWQIWNSAGRIPLAVRVGRSNLWRFDELRAWVEAGCPRRDAWEVIRREPRRPTRARQA